MKKDKETTLCAFDVVTLVSVLVAIALMVTLLITNAALQKKESYFTVPNPVVLAFLDEFVPLQSTVEQETVLEKYFSCINPTTINHAGASQDLLNFTAIFKRSNPVATDYRVCESQKNYLEIMLTDAEGNDLPPRIGFYYQLNGDNLISSYTVARHQPLAKTDPEWSREWR